jgi:hypothetical protein
LIVAATTVTAQSKLWLHGNKVINLSDSYNITVSDLPTPSGPDGLVYDGSMPTLTEHVEYDSNGNILFFMIDGKIYNKDGYLLVKNFQSASGLYNAYPERMISFSITRVPHHCSKFYLIGNYIPMGEQISSSEPHFFIALLDLELNNTFFPGQPDKSGALVNWDQAPFGYPINLIQVPNLGASGGATVVSGGTVLISLNSGASNALVNKPTVQFSLLQLNDEELLLSTAQYLNSFTWKLNSSGLTFIEPNNCNTAVNDFIYFYENRSMAYNQGGNVKLTNAYFQSNGPYVNSLNPLNFSSISCTSLSGGSNIATEITSDGSKFFAFSGGTIKCYESLTTSTPPINLTNIPTIANANLWSKGCFFRRNYFQGVESIYVFHEGGVDVIKGTNNPATATYFANVIPVAIPLMTNASLSAAMADDSNYNNIGLFSGLSSATNLIIAPIQVYNRIDEIIPSSECCVFETNYNAEGNITINSNQIWSPGNNPFNNSMGPIHISGTVTVPFGKTLQITLGLEVRFDENASIQVQAGGMLRLTNCKLTSYECEGRMWQGIDVYGPGTNNNTPQSTTSGGSSGNVLVSSNAIIENAIIGIEVGNTTSNSGGVVRVLSGRFINNQTGVKFSKYSYQQNGLVAANKSYFNNCRFETNATLKNSELNPLAHLDLNGVVKLMIQNSNFENTTPIEADTLWDTRGIGIRSFNSSFSCVGIPEIDYSFVNLTNGISQLNFGSPIASFVCKGMHFNGCYGGIVNIASNNIEVYGNKFTINQIDAVDMQDDELETGIYCIGSTGYSIEQNVFEGVDTALDTGNFPSGQGVRINGSGPADNKVRNNDFSNLLIGIHAEKQNMSFGAKFQTGLQFLCNDFAGDKMDIYRDAFATIRQDQGGNQQINNAGTGSGTTTSIPAYNKFSEAIPDCSSYSDFLISPSNIDYTNYWHNGQEIQIPNCVTNNGTFNLLSNGFVGDVEGACSNKYTVSSTHLNSNNGIILQHRAQIGVLRTQLRDKIALYEQVVDKNQKVGSLTLIETAFPNESEFVKNLLLQRHPLSDEVIKRLIQHASKFEAWHLTQVFVANSPLDKKILAEIEQTGILSPFFMTFIYNANDNPGATLRKMMEMDITNTASQIDELSFDIAKHVLHQYDFSIDSSEYAIPLYELSGVTFMSSEEDQLKLQAALKLFNGQDASEQFAALNMSTEEINILNMALSGVQDSTSIALLESYLQHSNEVVAQQAEILLDYLNHSSMIPPTQLPIQYRSLFTTSESKRTAEKLPLMGASPNPANNYCYIHYPIEADGIAVLSVVDIQGREILSTRLNHNGLIEIETSDLENGVYIGRLVVDDKLLESIKITVLH